MGYIVLETKGNHKPLTGLAEVKVRFNLKTDTTLIPTKIIEKSSNSNFKHCRIERFETAIGFLHFYTTPAGNKLAIASALVITSLNNQSFRSN